MKKQNNVGDVENSEQTSSYNPLSGDGRDAPRRGRPVSLEVLKRKLAEAEQRAVAERDKRRTQVAEARDKAARAVAEKMVMRGELAEVRRELAAVTRQWASERKAAARAARKAAAWEVALERFRRRWEKEYQEKEARARKRGPGRPKKRGRPKGSRNKPKESPA